jgi:hypothetical protein
MGIDEGYFGMKTPPNGSVIFIKGIGKVEPDPISATSGRNLSA